MPRKCSVPGCRSNYDTTNTHVNTFRFPKDEQLCKKWISNINRENFTPGSCACVCILHFEEHFILREDRATRADGTILIVPRKIPVLTKDAYPTIFRGPTKYSSTPRPLKRKAPEERQAEFAKIYDSNFQKWCEADKISTFADFNKCEMVQYCCVPFCKSGYKSNPDISFHEIPADIELCNEWLKAISRKGWFPNYNSNYSRVCSLHFLPSDFKSNLKRRILLPTAVPSIFPNHQYVPDSSKKSTKSAVDEKQSEVPEETSTDCRLVEGIDMLMEENISVNKSIGLHGGTHILSNAGDLVTILIHYHTESLTAVEYGTALDVVCWLHQQKRLSHVYFTETHPSGQSNQLTAHELIHEQIPATLICDSMVSALLHTKKISAVVVGAHKVAANGDTASEIGTYHIAISAQYHGVPFYVASPSSTMDMTMENGSLIPVEERPLSEMSKTISQKFAADGISCWNPAIDITPAELITGGFITEHGVLPASSLKKLEESLSSSKFIS